MRNGLIGALIGIALTSAAWLLVGENSTVAPRSLASSTEMVSLMRELVDSMRSRPSVVAGVSGDGPDRDPPQAGEEALPPPQRSAVADGVGLGAVVRELQGIRAAIVRIEEASSSAAANDLPAGMNEAAVRAAIESAQRGDPVLKGRLVLSSYRSIAQEFGRPTGVSTHGGGVVWDYQIEDYGNFSVQFCRDSVSGAWGSRFD